MTNDDLSRLIENGENEKVEFKGTGKLLVQTVGKLITSFLNTKGGRILIGVRDSQEIVGIDDEHVNRLKTFTINTALQNIKPKAVISFSTVKIEGKTLGIIDVPEGKAKPYGYRGSYFKREGTINVEIDQIDIFEFYSTQKKYNERSIIEILEKVNSIEEVLKDKIGSNQGTNIFISHGHHPETREKVEEFIEVLGLNPIVVLQSASDGLSVDAKIDKYIKNCVASIIIYTPDDELKNGKFLPRQNVIHETGILQRDMPEKIIYLKEKSVSLPTNIAPKVYLSFEKNDLTEAFIQIIKELKSFEVL